MKRPVPTYLKRLEREREKKSRQNISLDRNQKDPKSTCDLMNQITGVFLWRYVT